MRARSGVMPGVLPLAVANWMPRRGSGTSAGGGASVGRSRGSTVGAGAVIAPSSASAAPAGFSTRLRILVAMPLLGPLDRRDELGRHRHQQAELDASTP